MDAALLRRVEQQRVEMLYGNALAVSGSALLDGRDDRGHHLAAHLSHTNHQLVDRDAARAGRRSCADGELSKLGRSRDRVELMGLALRRGLGHRGLRVGLVGIRAGRIRISR